MTNRNGIEQLFKMHYAQMHRLALALLHDEDSARDVVHDIFASLLHSDSDALPTGGYLLRMVRNRCLNLIRDTDIHERIVRGYFLDMDEYDEEEFPNDETIAAIDSIVKSQLPEQCTRVVELRFYEGLHFADVAKEMGISPTAVFKHLRRALTLIRKKLKENGQI